MKLFVLSQNNAFKERNCRSRVRRPLSLLKSTSPRVAYVYLYCHIEFAHLQSAGEISSYSAEP